MALVSRKDVRDAVVAARAAQSGWASNTAYLRGQILYRITEMLEGRRGQFVAEIRELTSKSEKAANQEVDAAIDSWVWHAGWSDKIDAVAGNVNAVDLEGARNGTELEIEAAQTIKRVIRCCTYDRSGSAGRLQHILDLMEVKTFSHPKGH